MLTKEIYDSCKARAIEYLEKAHIAVTQQELDSFEVAEYNLDDVNNIGLELVVYVNTDRYCAKELILFPGQTCPEHRHPPIEGAAGKQETFRCRYGQVFLYIEGPAKENIQAVPPASRAEYFTCRNEIILNPGEQYTIPPNTLHWFQAGPEGCVVSEFSSTSRDECDIYTDPVIIAAQERCV